MTLDARLQVAPRMDRIAAALTIAREIAGAPLKVGVAFVVGHGEKRACFTIKRGA